MARSSVVAALVVLAGCGARTGLDEPPPCLVDVDCEGAGDFCSGAATCRLGRCVSAPAPDCTDDSVCTVDSCDGAARSCRHDVRDRDGDGFTDGSCGGVDCDDHDPSIHPGATELCSGGRDEDCDEHVDCSDPDCAADPRCVMCRPEVCSGGVDEDCDSLVDCADADCIGTPACCRPTEELCDDARDEDCDGLVDCLDPGCVHAPTCCVPSAETCNGVDDNCDGVADDGVQCFTLDGTPLAAIVTATCGSAWYAYGSPSTASANPVPDVRMSSSVAVAIQVGPPSCGGATIAVIADQVMDGSGGTLDGSFGIDVPGVSSPVLVSDDPGECAFHAAANEVDCNWDWQPCCTDGVLLGPFPGDFCVAVRLDHPSGVSTLLVHDGPVATVPRSFGTAFTLCGTTIPAV